MIHLKGLGHEIELKYFDKKMNILHGVTWASIGL